MFELLHMIATSLRLWSPYPLLRSSINVVRVSMDHIFGAHRSARVVEVLPDWHGGHTVNGVLTEGALQEFENKCRQLFAAQSDDTTPIKGSLLRTLQANRDAILAEDHALVLTTGRGLAHFLPSRRVGTTQAGERRYFVGVATLPPHLQACSPGRAQRACIYNARTNETRLEVSWQAPRPALFFTTDMGSAAWQGKRALFNVLGLRGGAIFDPPHRKHRNHILACNRAGLHFVRLEYAICQNYLRGPYGSQGHFGTVKAAAVEYYSSRDCSDHIFQYLYEPICEAYYGGEPPPGYGTIEHQQHVFALCAECPLLKRIGPATAFGRWFTWSKKNRFHEHDFAMLLPPLLYINIVRGSISSIADVPSFLTHAPPADEGDGDAAEAEPRPAGSSGDPLPRMSVRDSTRRVDAAQRRLKNKSLFVAGVLSNPFSRKLMLLATYVPMPMELRHNLDVQAFATQRGCLDWAIGMASASYTQMLRDIWATLQNTELLRKVGFTAHQPVVCDAMHRENIVVANTAVELCRHLISLEIETNSYYSHRPPFMYLQALSKDALVRAAVMVWCKRAWDVVTGAEEIAFGSAVVRRHLSSMLWPAQQWDREVLLSAREADFSCFPPDIVEGLQSFGRGLMTTVPVEVMHNRVTDATRNNKGGVLGRFGRWHQLVTSLIAEQNDRPRPVVTNAVRYAAACQNQSKTIFEASAGTPSIPVSEIDGSLHAKAIYQE